MSGHNIKCYFEDTHVFRAEKRVPITDVVMKIRWG